MLALRKLSPMSIVPKNWVNMVYFFDNINEQYASAFIAIEEKKVEYKVMIVPVEKYCVVI